MTSDPRHPASHTLQLQTSLLLWLLAFLPRLVLSTHFYHQPIGLDDMFQYDMLARSIIKGDGYRWYAREDFNKLRPYYEQFMDVEQITVPEKGLKTAFRAPGYPLFLSGVYAFAPKAERVGWARIAQSALTATLAPLTAWIAISQNMKKKTAILSGMVIAFYPILLFYPLALASENTFLPLLAAGFLLLLRIKPQHHYAVLSSALTLGLSTLTRSVIAPFLFFSAGWMRLRKGIQLKHVATFLAVALGLCLPWAVRNSLFMNKPTFLESNLGYNLFVSYHPQGTGAFVSEIAIKPLRYLDDQSRDRYTTRKALQFIKDDPQEALGRVLKKVAFFLGVEDKEMIYFYGNGFFGKVNQPWRLGLYLLLIMPWILILALAPVGLMLHDHREGADLTLGLLALYSLPHFLIMAEPRFHLALVPVLLPYAVHAWTVRGSIRDVLFSNTTKRKRVLLFLTWALLLGFLVWSFSLHWDTLIKIMGPEGHQLHPTY